MEPGCEVYGEDKLEWRLISVRWKNCALRSESNNKVEGQGSVTPQSPFSLLLACAECNMSKAVGKARCIWGKLPLGTSRMTSWKTIALKMKETGLKGEGQKTEKEDPQL